MRLCCDSGNTTRSFGLSQVSGKSFFTGRNSRDEWWRSRTEQVNVAWMRLATPLVDRVTVIVND